MESEVAEEEKRQFLDMWGDFFFGYIWMDMDFTVLGRTPAGVQVSMLVLQKQKHTGKEEGSGRGD